MSTEFQAKPVTKTKGSGLLRVKPNHQFLYMHNPNGWEMVETEEGLEWIPVLKRFLLRPGLNGIRSTRRGGVDYVNAKARFEQNGWTFIMPDEVEGGYLVEYEGEWGTVYSDLWNTPRSLGAGRNTRIVWDHDRAGWMDFRKSLTEHLGGPDPSVIDLKTTVQKKRAARKIKEVHIPAVAKKVAREVKTLEAMEASKPKRKRTTRKASLKKTSKKAKEA